MLQDALDVAPDHPDPDAFIRAVMDWHFSPTTGSPYWLARAKSLGFDPRADIKSFEDLTLFPNVINELRDVRAADLIPRAPRCDRRLDQPRGRAGLREHDRGVRPG
ncbi:MAG: hypothetical protein QOF43_60 [Gaiellaceae bacterium]|jgi:hypothetical protein|nr:hypothetical protein [Gaiellaceae bacterium]